MTKTEHPAYFEQQHERLDAQLHAHLLDVVGGDFAGALQRLQQWRRDLDRHTEIENARLLEESLEKRRLEEDMRVAAEIQRSMLPKASPSIAGYDVAAGTEPYPGKNGIYKTSGYP